MEKKISPGVYIKEIDMSQWDPMEVNRRFKCERCDKVLQDMITSVLLGTYEDPLEICRAYCDECKVEIIHSIKMWPE